MIRVAIIEDVEDVRTGLARLIGGAEGFSCTGAYRSLEEGVAGMRRDPTDVVLLDIGLPRISGVEGIPWLNREFPGVLVLMLTIYEDDERIFSALCAGARGYLLKKTPAARLIEAIREVVDGGAPMSPEVARKVVELFRRFKPAAAQGHDLSPHELRLLLLLVEGHNYRTAALRLGVSVNTISFHIRNIYDKLQVHSKSEAVAKALRMGLAR
jgi:DNA-binding NarL/FixJ family response regulator